MVIVEQTVNSVLPYFNTIKSSSLLPDTISVKKKGRHLFGDPSGLFKE